MRTATMSFPLLVLYFIMMKKRLLTIRDDLKFNGYDYCFEPLSFTFVLRQTYTGVAKILRVK